MPGLVGIIGKGQPSELRDELRRMLAALYRTDDYLSGSFVDEQLRAYVGWTCFRGSYADCLPVRDAADGLSLFFAGEHFPSDPAEEARLASGAGCSPDKAEVLLPLYKKMGTAFFPYLNGFFHGLIIDPREGRVVLFNDRFGMQRVYYHEQPDRLYFASEAKAILAVRPELRAFDPQGLGEWLSCGAALENRSLFKHVYVLPGGCRWTWGPGSIFLKTQYFSPEMWEELPRIESKDSYQRLKEVFLEKLPNYLRWPGTIGLSATGGLDTRMILANAKLSGDKLSCYTFCGPLRESLDVTIARRLAGTLGYPHKVLRINDQFFSQFDRLARNIVMSTDGNLGMSGVPELYLNEMARDISPVRLTGNYGSEILRCYRSLESTDSICRVLHKDLAEQVRNARRTLARAVSGHPLTYLAFKQIPWFSYNRLQSEQAVLIMRTPFMENAFLQVIYQAPDIHAESMDYILRLIRDGEPGLADIMTDRGVTYPKKPDWPVSRAYYELIFRLEYFASYGMPKFATSLDRRLGFLSFERNFLGRNKYYHYRQWFRDQLAPYVKEMLLDERTLSRSFLTRNDVVRLLEAHLTGRDNNTDIIESLLTLELTTRLLLESDNG